MTYYVYVITDVTNGKVYVGQTNNPEYRFGQHFRRARSNRRARVQRLYVAMHEKGLDKFTMKTVAKTEFPDMINHLECYWIAKLKACLDKHGYNGGWNGTAHSEHTTAERRLELSCARRERARKSYQRRLVL